MTPNLHISYHPVIQTKLSQLRQKDNTPKIVRELTHELAVLLAYEATMNLKTSKTKEMMSPYESYKGTELAERIALVPVLRSGLGLLDGFLQMLPDAHVLHLGLYREKISLQPVEYYNKLPQNADVDLCIVVDPIIATGNTAVATVNILKEWGVRGSQIKYVSILGSLQGISQLQTEHPDINIYAAAVDDTLDENGYIRPGVGDTGDRLWNTLF
ncbi:uracil phosphoribosyltransferase-domain-containing protein [Radiomyces spectabilis]|uniref:uracil phosphoribosyltransferase-domain-containing protein n=1 Tax=Radiomyces spectabilis TaxID=64574 RepID=UPI00221EFE7B|nr:uracil phosphoribosyltransferase-domain-containing protein [Radiomyces spectabilis]KAI8374148.1 uracil phosphoribosyltransferase-domain-containing protein [Radiomyces spectabilis]